MTTPKRTSAQLRKREGELLEELQTQHGYAFADTLSKAERSSIMGQRTAGKLKLSAVVVLKVFVPHDGLLGKAVVRTRAKTAKLIIDLKAAKLRKRTKAVP